MTISINLNFVSLEETAIVISILDRSDVDVVQRVGQINKFIDRFRKFP